MATVRFAIKCDKCGRRSPEYGSWPYCRECGDDTCPNCDVPSERTEDEANKTLCVGCRDAEGAANPGPRKIDNALPQISYPEFCRLVLTASGPFSYQFGGDQHVCYPDVYKALHGTTHLLRAEKLVAGVAL